MVSPRQCPSVSLASKPKGTLPRVQSSDPPETVPLNIGSLTERVSHAPKPRLYPAATDTDLRARALPRPYSPPALALGGLRGISFNHCGRMPEQVEEPHISSHHGTNLSLRRDWPASATQSDHKLDIMGDRVPKERGCEGRRRPHWLHGSRVLEVRRPMRHINCHVWSQM